MYDIKVGDRILNPYLNNMNGGRYGIALYGVNKTLQGVMQVRREWYIDNQRFDINKDTGVVYIEDYNDLYVKLGNSGSLDIGVFNLTIKNCNILTIKPLENDNREYGLKIENITINTNTMLIPKDLVKQIRWERSADQGWVTIDSSDKFIRLKDLVDISRLESFDIFNIHNNNGQIRILAQMYYDTDPDSGRGNYRPFPETTTTFKLISR